MSARRIAFLGLLGLALAGVYGLYDVLDERVFFVAGAIAVLCLIRPLRGLLYWPGVVVLPLLALVGFNVLWEAVELPRLSLGAGLAVAVAVFAAAAFVHLRWRVSFGAAGGGGLILALVVIIGVPIAISRAEVDRSEVPTPRPIVSQLDVLIVVGGDGDAAELPAIKRDTDLPSWDIRYSVAHVEGDELRWELVDSDNPEAARRAAAGRRVGDPPDPRPPVDAVPSDGEAAGGGEPAGEATSDGSARAGRPTLRPGADHAVVLVVDGTPPVVLDPAGLPGVAGEPDEVERWQGLARRAAPAGTPTFALLQTTDDARLDRWRRWLRDKDGEPVSIQRSGGQTVTDTAVHLATLAPTAREDMALAFKHRPVLLFDSGEPVGTPLDIASFFASGRVKLCHEEVRRTRCEVVRRSADLVNDATHLRLDLPPFRRKRRRPRSSGAGPQGPVPGTRSTVYVNPVRARRGGRRLLFLDYWWYLPYNPAGTAKGSLCGAGMVIPGKTCFDHESDWEGVTVVVDMEVAEPLPVYVHYAEHEAVVRYPWEQVSRVWRRDAYRRLVRRLDDADDRPLVFVARGTHASYPRRCGGRCRQTAERVLPEQPHRGNAPWDGNDTAICAAHQCLEPFPTRARGAEPALWNAFDGTWGERNCILVYFCDSDDAPTAPSTKRRYVRPWKYHGHVDARGRYRRFVEPPPPPKP